MNLEPIFNIPPYSLDKHEKKKIFNGHMNQLTRHHFLSCDYYRRMLNALDFDQTENYTTTDIPFLPVRLFKMHDFYSVLKKDIVKTMTSSGTSGQKVSKIFLDKQAALNQSKALTKIVSSFLGQKRTPMIIIDTASILKNRNNFSARGAGILGFSIFGTKRIYALNEDMELNVNEVISFIKKNEGNRIFIFGFTFMVYQHFIKTLRRNSVKIDLSNAVLIHGGGWKKLIKESVTTIEFRKMLYDLCGIKSVHDYYGMVEQTGSIYMECENRNLHAPIFSDIIIRRAHDFSVADVGEQGIIQTLSVLPTSYPGHSLLTEDEGILLGEDGCTCGRLGKYFKIVGRIKNAELRGCSDTYADEF